MELTAKTQKDKKSTPSEWTKVKWGSVVTDTYLCAIVFWKAEDETEVVCTIHIIGNVSYFIIINLKVLFITVTFNFNNTSSHLLGSQLKYLQFKYCIVNIIMAVRSSVHLGLPSG